MSFISGGNWNSSLITLDSLKNSRAHIQNDDELDLDSEKSHQPLYTRDEISELVTFLNFNIRWMFTAACANVYLYISYSYEAQFDANFGKYMVPFLLNWSCNVITVVDIVALLIHLTWRHVADRRYIAPHNRAVATLDVLSLLSVTHEFLQKPTEIRWLMFFILACVIFRLYRVIRYFYVASVTAGVNNVKILWKKYGMLLFLVIHSFSCIWMYMGCYKCDGNKNKDWTDTVAENFYDVDKFNPSEWYTVCVYYTMSQMTAVGFGDIHSYDLGEGLLTIAMLLLGYILVTATYVGAWTSVQVENYRRHSQYALLLQLIKDYITDTKIPRSLRRKISDYYITFWFKQGGIKSSALFNSLPPSIKREVFLDSYWFALEQSYLLRNANEAFKRAVATVMRTEYYTVDEVIYEQGKQKHYMAFIAQGSVKILSAEDNESSILTFGMGTLLGESSLVVSSFSPVQVTASSYCVLQLLDKSDFWKVASEYYKLKQSEMFHKMIKEKIGNAETEQEHKYNNEKEKVLTLVKAQLKTEEPRGSDGYFNIKSASAEEYSSYSDLYILSRQETTMKHSDEICLHTTWPWIMQPQSVLLTIWEYIVVVVMAIVAIIFPYNLAFSKTNLTESVSMAMIDILIDVVFAIDVIMQMFTAMVDGNVIITKFSEIFAILCRKYMFILDILCILPLDTIAKQLSLALSSTTWKLLNLNRLFKIHKVISVMRRLSTSFGVNVAIVRCIKYVLYLVFIVYFMAAFFYLQACYKDSCSETSWVNKLTTVDVAENGTRYLYPFEVSMYCAMLIVSTTGFGDVTAANIHEVYMMLMFFIIGTLIFSFLVSDYSATLMLAGRSRAIYLETVNIIRTFLIGNRILMSIQHRVNDYLSLQWLYNKGFKIIKGRKLVHDCSQSLYVQLQSAKYKEAFSTLPVFQSIDDEFLEKLTINCQTLFLPPNEIVIYAGEISKHMYIIERGFCILISAASGKVEKVLGPNSHFCVFESLVAKAGIFNIRTVTHVRLMIVSINDVKRCFAEYPHIHKQLTELVEATSKSLTVQRLFMKTSNVVYLDIKEEESISWFVFPKKKLDPRSIDYERAFSNIGLWRFSRSVLLRRTIIPDGNFIMFWEMFRATCAFISGMLYPSIMIYSIYFPNIVYWSYVLDIFGYIDIYIRMHVCYYNKKGILVTHPKYTALYYLKRGFFGDLLGLLPTGHMLYLFVAVHYDDPGSVSSFYTIQGFCNFNKLLQMYRLPDAFMYFQKDILKTKSVLLNVLMYIPISLVFFNVLASSLIILTSDFALDSDGCLMISPMPDSWMSHFIQKENIAEPTPIAYYITAYYWVAATCLNVGFGDIQAQQSSEMYFIIFAIIAGYFTFTYVLVVISSSIASININLTLYQEHMKQLIKYMKRERIEKSLQNRAIDHFEYLWQRTHGLKANKILKKCHQALQQDSILSLYEQTMLKVPIFTDLNRSFFRKLGTHLEEKYFLKDTPVIKLNDIISTVYIVHKGEAVAKGPDGSTFTTLKRGCMFGNIDDIASTRSMISITAGTAVDLLSIETRTLYSLSKDYPVVASRLKRHILLENLSFIKVQHKSETTISIENPNIPLKLFAEEKLKTTKLQRFLMSAAFNLPSMLMSFLSCLVVSHHMAFQNHNFLMYFMTYSLDVFHLIKLYAGFYKPFRNKLGEMVTNRDDIKERYMCFSHFYLDLFGLLPFEVFAFLAPVGQKQHYLAWLRINRLVRMWSINHFFNVSYNRLNINVMVFKLGSIAVHFSLMIHIGACLLFIVGCPGLHCVENGWIRAKDDLPMCKDSYYVCSLYFIMTIVTATGTGDIYPKNTIEHVLITIMMVFAKFTLAIFIGDMSAIVQNYSYTLVNYDHGMVKLKEFLKNSDICAPLLSKVLSYSNQLWSKQCGQQLPILLVEAPSYLREDIKAAAYGHHLYQNYIFVSCHNDFLRLLIAELQVLNFFTGDMICQQGDVNNRMFFIHKGKVEVLAIEQNIEIQVDELHEKDCFGIVQGLFLKTPHTHSFRAATVTEILTLDLSSWLYLLRYFPAARYEIYERVQNI